MGPERTTSDAGDQAGALLLALVRKVRGTRAPHTSRRKIVRAAKRRRRRSAAVSAMTGPFAPAALQVAALHADACTVCELDAAHGLRMSDELLAAHLLVLWSVVDDVDVAHAAVERRGDRSVTGLLAGRLRETAGAALPEELTKRALVGAVWRVRTMRPDAKRGAVRTALRPGPVAKRFIQRAELQLGVH